MAGEVTGELAEKVYLAMKENEARPPEEGDLADGALEVAEAYAKEGNLEKVGLYGKEAIRHVSEVEHGRGGKGSVSQVRLNRIRGDANGLIAKVSRDLGDAGGAEKYQQRSGATRHYVGLGAIAAGLFLSAPVLTGNAVASFSSGSSSLVGAVLLVVGIGILFS